MQGNLACWTSLRTTGVHWVPSKINTIMICCSRIIAGLPGLAQAEIKTCCWSSSLAAKAADGWFFLLDHCKINSVLRDLRKGYLGESSKEHTLKHFFYSLLFKKSLHYIFIFPLTTGKFYEYRKLFSLVMQTTSANLYQWPCPYCHGYILITLTFNFITKKIPF